MESIVEREEHILVCLSASSTNERLIISASKMAEAFHGKFTALYIQPIKQNFVSREDEMRLNKHINLARKLGAEIATITGDDVPLLISEYASVADVTKIVIGRSGERRRFFFPKQKLTERLIQLAPNIDIYIMPDQNRPEAYHKNKGLLLSQQIFPSLSDIAIMCVILAFATLLCLCFQALGFTEANIITVYILGVLLASLATDSYLTGVIVSVMSVILFNFFFTEPRMTLHAYGAGYPVTFFIMLSASVITGSLAGKLNQDAKLLASDAYRTKVLYDTDKLLEQAEGQEEILQIAGKQLSALLQRNVITVKSDQDDQANLYTCEDDVQKISLNEQEKEIIHWVYSNHKRAGGTTNVFSKSSRLYLAIRVNTRVYGIVGIDIMDRQFNAHENSIVLSILGDCALTLDNERIRKEKDEAALIAKNEQLRSNLLRTISHDLRTPLTSISGDASILIERYQELDDETRKQMFNDIYDDSQWLYNVVENLLSVTRFEEGKMNLHFSDQVVEDLVNEAMKHIDRKKNEHNIVVEEESDVLLVKVDARLIMQVIINIVNNAIKYTPVGSKICILASKEGKYAKICIADNGSGLSDDVKAHVFEMFYTGEKSADHAGRALGLGLSLCKSVIEAHGGTICVEDNVPHGCIFSFTLPLSEAIINE